MTNDFPLGGKAENLANLYHWMRVRGQKMCTTAPCWNEDNCLCHGRGAKKCPIAVMMETLNKRLERLE